MVEVFSIIVVIVLVSCSGLFSGLTLGLMSLDLTGLEIVIAGGTPQERAYAETIKPVRKDGNLLLCTLLLGNVAVNAALSIVLADIAGGLVGFLASTIIITLMGEIFPQAACSRHALMVGAKTVWLVRFFMLILFPLTWPLARVLDKILGKEIGTLYSKNEFKKLVEMHRNATDIKNKEANILSGALDFGTRQVHEIMTPIEHVYMLEVHRKLDFSTLSEIFKSGYSRIPVFDETKEMDSVVGLLITKDLILIDPGVSTRESLVACLLLFGVSFWMLHAHLFHMYIYICFRVCECVFFCCCCIYYCSASQIPSHISAPLTLPTSRMRRLSTPFLSSTVVLLLVFSRTWS